MLKSALLPLALLALSAQAHAFPPCPSRPIEMVPGRHPDRPPTPGTLPWFVAGYALEGHPLVVAAIAPDPSYHSKCRPGDDLPTPSAHPGTPYLGASMRRAPDAGYGLIQLPDIRAHDPGQTLTYALHFTVDSAPLARDGEWFDVAELVLGWTHPLSTKSPHDIASVFRVRKYRKEEGTNRLQVIASRRARPDEPALPIRTYDEVVATILLDEGSGAAPIQLRWSQRTRNRGGTGRKESTSGLPVPAAFGQGSATLPATTVDTIVEVIGANGQVLFRQALAGQWASDLSLGLLDYSVHPQSLAHYAQHAPRIDGMRLDAYTH